MLLCSSHLWRITVMTCFHANMHVASQRLSINASSVLKFTFLTVTCFNGASSLCVAFREWSAEIQHLFTQQASLSEGQHSPQNVAEWPCFLPRVFISAKDGGAGFFFRNLRSECTVERRANFEVCLPMGQKYKFKLKGKAILTCLIPNNRTILPIFETFQKPRWILSVKNI